MAMYASIALQIGIVIFLICVGMENIKGSYYGMGAAIYKYITVADSALGQEELNEIKNMPDVEAVIPCSIGYFRTNMLLFNTGGTKLLGVEKNRIEQLISVLDLEIVEGTMPKQPGEVMITDKTAAVLKLKLGDWAGKDYDGKLSEVCNYKVTGIAKAEYNIALTVDKPQTGKFIILTKEGSITAVRENLKKKAIKGAAWADNLENFIEVIQRDLSRMGMIAFTVFFIGLYVTLESLWGLYIDGKKEEINLLRKIGYSFKQIRRRCNKEYRSVLIKGVCLGEVLGQISAILFAYLYCEVQGVPYILWHPLFIIVPLVYGIIIYLLGSWNMHYTLKKELLY